MQSFPSFKDSVGDGKTMGFTRWRKRAFILMTRYRTKRLLSHCTLPRLRPSPCVRKVCRGGTRVALLLRHELERWVRLGSCFLLRFRNLIGLLDTLGPTDCINCYQLQVIDGVFGDHSAAIVGFLCNELKNESLRYHRSVFCVADVSRSSHHRAQSRFPLGRQKAACCRRSARDFDCSSPRVFITHWYGFRRRDVSALTGSDGSHRRVRRSDCGNL